MLQVCGKYVIFILLIAIQRVCCETSPSESQKCLIPDKPELQNLHFKLHPQNHTIELGSYVDEYETVNIECNNKNKLRGVASLICQNGEWIAEFPKCSIHCDATLLRSLSLRAICGVRNVFIECPEKILPGTAVHVNCAFGYTRYPKSAQVLQCLADGTFDKIPEPCEQLCGRTAPASTALTKDGVAIESSVAPWHVSIYENNNGEYAFRCSGSIVSPTVIVSAANCFWNRENSSLKSAAIFQIIAGRNTSNYTSEQTLYSQLVKVQEIHVPLEYKGNEGQQRDNVAFLRLETPLRYSETIAPICMPSDLRATTSEYVLSNKTGFISGFGATNQLERLKMVTLAYHDCVDKSPPDTPVTDDKFCLYNTEGGLVCRGASGAGFFTQGNDLREDVIVYKLLGVISHMLKNASQCSSTDDEAYVAVTNIFSLPYDFKQKLFKAINDDRSLLKNLYSNSQTL